MTGIGIRSPRHCTEYMNLATPRAPLANFIIQGPCIGPPPKPYPTIPITPYFFKLYKLK